MYKLIFSSIKIYIFFILFIINNKAFSSGEIHLSESEIEHAIHVTSCSLVIEELQKIRMHHTAILPQDIMSQYPKVLKDKVKQAYFNLIHLYDKNCLTHPKKASSGTFENDFMKLFSDYIVILSPEGVEDDFFCHGFITGNHLLTAYHCLYDASENIYHNKIIATTLNETRQSFTLDLNELENDRTLCGASDVLCSKEQDWIFIPLNEKDFERLPEPINMVVKEPLVKDKPQLFIYSINLNTIDYLFSEEISGKRDLLDSIRVDRSQSCTVLGKKEREYKHTCKTSPGSNGAPIFLIDKNSEIYFVGIHLYNFATGGNINKLTMIDHNALKQINNDNFILKTFILGEMQGNESYTSFKDPYDYPIGYLKNTDKLTFYWQPVQEDEDRTLVYNPVSSQELTFVRSNGDKIIVKKMLTDGASIPKFFQNKKGLYPFNYLPAFLIHDWLYELKFCDKSYVGTNTGIEYTHDDARDTMMEVLNTMRIEGYFMSKHSMNMLLDGINNHFSRKAWRNKKNKTELMHPCQGLVKAYLDSEGNN